MQSLRLFCDVAAHRSFSQAAVNHRITQSAASQRIGQLEKRLGVKLIDRSVRPLALTAAGTEFLRGCQQLLERYDQLAQRVSCLKPLAQGTVRVDAIYSAGIDLLNHVKESFESLHADVKVTLEYKRPDEVYQAVRDRRCDLGIVSYPQRWQQVQTIPLRDELMTVACSPRHPLAHARSIHASQLQQWPMVMVEPGLPVGRRIRRYLREHGVNPNVSSEFDNFDTIKSAVSVTDQIAILPKRTILREVRSGSLAVVDLEPTLVRPMGIILRRPRSSQSSWPAARAFIEFLQQHAGPSDEPVEQTDTAARQLASTQT